MAHLATDFAHFTEVINELYERGNSEPRDSRDEQLLRGRLSRLSNCSHSLARCWSTPKWRWQTRESHWTTRERHWMLP